MNKEKLMSLIKYQTQLKDRLVSDIPAKHTRRPDSFKQFLKNELETVSVKIEAAKLQLGGK